MTPLSEAWLDYAWAMLWQSTVLMIAVWLMYALSWKRSAAFRYALLCLILLKFLLPASLHSVTGIGHWFGSVEQKLATPLTPPVPKVAPPHFEYAPIKSTPSALTTPFPPIDSPRVSTQEAETHLPTFLFSVWLGGVVFLATLLLFHALRIRERFSNATQVNDPGILRLLNDCREKMGVSMVIPIYQLSGLSSPVLAGLVRPRILVAPETLEHLKETHLRPIFLHELAHAKRCDLWVNTLQIVLQVLWFFHPGLWLTNWLIRRERERACDDLVLAKMENAGRDYADSILEVLKGSGGRSGQRSGCWESRKEGRR